MGIKKLGYFLPWPTPKKTTSKLKPLLDLTVSRLTVLRNRGLVRCNQARGDVAQLLQLGHLDRALLRAEHVIKEQNMFDVFTLLDSYCHLLIERILLLEHKECPEELREAISSMIFAASRCAELPEISKIRGIFSTRYGGEFASAAVELRNDCSVNQKMIQMLSTRQPSLEMRRRVTKEIAAEKGITLKLEDDDDDDDAAEIVEITWIQRESTKKPPVTPNEEPSSEKNPPTRRHRKYKDAESAAQDAFEAAAFAAAAARAAVELCRSESRAKGSGDGNKAGGSKAASDETNSAAKDEKLDRDGSVGHLEKRVQGASSSSTSESSEEEDYEIGCSQRYYSADEFRVPVPRPARIPVKGKDNK